MAVIYNKIAIIGMGLIGASIARASRRAGLAAVLAGYDSDPAAMADVVALQLVDEVADSAAGTVSDADLVIMAVPVGVVGAVAESIVPHMKPGAVLTDTGSTKRSVLRDVAPYINETIIWLPSHPLAGTEHSGPQAGQSDLIAGRYRRLMAV